MRKIWFLCLCLCIVFIIFITLTGCSNAIIDTTINDAAYDNYGNMGIYIFDVGKADAILLTTENQTVMIDTGEKKDSQEITDYLISQDISVIDYMIITHFDKDHVGGAAEILHNFNVKALLIPDYKAHTKHYDRLVTAMSETAINPNILGKGESFEFILDDIKFTVYASNLDYYDYSAEDDDEDEDEDDDELENDIPNSNNFSLVATINHGNNSFLFTGDAKAKRLKELMSNKDITGTEYDFLKVPHHGGYNKRSAEFINAIHPKYAVITCSEKNPPDSVVVGALEKSGAEIYLTANGNICCESDGNNLVLSHR